MGLIGVCDPIHGVLRARQDQKKKEAKNLGDLCCAQFLHVLADTPTEKYFMRCFFFVLF
jgi:hypothetical protein